MEKIFFAAVAACGFMCCSAWGASGALSAQDTIDIQQLYARYNIAIDSGDAQGWAATFTQDGVFNTISGHDALAEFVKTWREKFNGASRRHWNNNLQLTGNSTEASGFVFLMLIDVNTKPISIVGTATYTDSLVKTKDGWRFSKRTTKSDIAPVAPPASN
ncbi:MAG: nuclear transport factor 2 family protein [Pseudomonadota bacterium]|nr:nuclear transport factor 2 family protein [Pseudomonadota bacterium]